MLSSNKLYILSNNSNECKEKVDNNLGLELEEYFAQLPNEYKIDKQYIEALATIDDEEDE
jgi:hypothetical protein